MVWAELQPIRGLLLAARPHCLRVRVHRRKALACRGVRSRRLVAAAHPPAGDVRTEQKANAKGAAAASNRAQLPQHHGRVCAATGGGGRREQLRGRRADPRGLLRHTRAAKAELDGRAAGSRDARRPGRATACAARLAAAAVRPGPYSCCCARAAQSRRALSARQPRAALAWARPHLPAQAAAAFRPTAERAARARPRHGRGHDPSAGGAVGAVCPLRAGGSARPGRRAVQPLLGQRHRQEWRCAADAPRADAPIARLRRRPRPLRRWPRRRLAGLPRRPDALLLHGVLARGALPQPWLRVEPSALSAFRARGAAAACVRRPMRASARKLAGPKVHRDRHAARQRLVRRVAAPAAQLQLRAQPRRRR
mmetsp:Transcript_102/g.341  ORF Transcript_102/g.341 Transcript_102/m.341 type:complete len:367 (-) Transcript_102:8-1108(-)